MFAVFATYSGTDEGDIDYPTIPLPIGDDAGETAGPATARTQLDDGASTNNPIATITDQPLVIEVLDVVRENGLIVTTVSLQHAGGPAGALDINRRLKLGTGEQMKPLDKAATARLADGMHNHPVFLRPGFRRVVRAAFADPGGTSLILSYAGIGVNAQVPLELPDDGSVSAGATMAAAVTDSDPSGSGEPVVMEPQLSLDERSALASGRALEPVGIHGHGMTGVEINQAIEDGRDYLWAWLRESLGEAEGAVRIDRHVWGGYRMYAPVIFALIKSGAMEAYPEFAGVVDSYIKHWRSTETYAVAHYMMSIHALGLPRVPAISRANNPDAIR